MAAESGSHALTAAEVHHGHGPDANGTPERVGYALGVGLIVLGGLVAAVTGPLHWDRGSWLAAYLVLVCGVAQCVISHQSRILRTPQLTPARRLALLACWNAGNTLVIAGTLTSLPAVTDAGGVLLVAGLVLALAGTRRARRLAARTLLRAFYLVLMISIPVGLVLSHLRAGHG